MGSEPTAKIADLIENAVPPPPEAPQLDLRAKAEERRYVGEMDRHEQIRTCLHWMLIGAVVCIGLPIVLTIAFFFLHMFLPTKYRWISKEDTELIRVVLLSGGIGSALTEGARKVLGLAKGKEHED